MRSDELFTLGLKYYKGDGVAVNHSLAVQYFEGAANLGNSVAQYNMGVFYENGDGVEADYRTAASWYKKAADNGEKDAIDYVEKITSKDTALRAVVSIDFVKIASYMGFGSAGFDEVRNLADKIVSSVDQIAFPTADDLFQRREACRYLGLVTYMGADKQDLSENLLAKSYYDSGLPIHEATDMRTAVMYPCLLEDLSNLTGNASYQAEAYDAANAIYQNSFSRIDDRDYEAMILSFIINEKILGEFHPVDLAEAERLNEIVGTFGSDYYEEYYNRKQLIAEKRRHLSPPPSTTQATYASDQPSGKRKGFWNKFFG